MALGLVGAVAEVVESYLTSQVGVHAPEAPIAPDSIAFT
jgi:hypothetical protein